MIGCLTNYCLAEQKELPDSEVRIIRGIVQVWTTTTVIMWFYVVFLYVVFDFSTVGNLGVLFSVLHSLSPVIYRQTKSLTITLRIPSAQTPVPVG